MQVGQSLIVALLAPNAMGLASSKQRALWTRRVAGGAGATVALLWLFGRLFGTRLGSLLHLW